MKTPIDLWADRMYAAIEDIEGVAVGGRPCEPRNVTPSPRTSQEWQFYDAENTAIDLLKAKIKALEDDVDAYVDLVEDNAQILSGRVVGDGE